MHTHVRRSLLVAGLALFAACSAPRGPGDGGDESDAGDTRDAGDGRDAGPVRDAGGDFDAGVIVDAGTQPDYPIESLTGSCEVRWQRWGPASAESGTRLVAHGDLVWFSEVGAGRRWLVALSAETGAEVTRFDFASSGAIPPSIVPVEDVDGDAVGDVVLSYAEAAADVPSDAGIGGSGGSTTAHTELWSTSRRARLWERPQVLPGVIACCSVASIGDRDADGLKDLVVTSPPGFGPDGNFQAQPLVVLSLRTGVELRQVPLPAGAESSFGNSIVEVGDLNGDGQRDWFATDALGPTESFAFGAIYALDGHTGATLWRVVGSSEVIEQEQRPWLLGGGALSAMDLDGDGFDDALASAHNAPANGALEAGKLLALSGRDGSLLWLAEGRRAFDHLGASNAVGGNLSADGRPSVIVGVPGVDNRVAANGHIEVRAPADGRVRIELAAKGVLDCIDPTHPDAACMPDSFGASLAALPSPAGAIDLAVSAPGARGVDATTRGVVLGIRCQP